MSKEIEKVEVEEEVMVTDDEVDVAESETKKSKFKAGLKKCGKKIAIGAGILAVGIIGFMLGRKGSDDSVEIDYNPDDEPFALTDGDDSEGTEETE